MSKHILLVVLDSVRADHVSAYGYARETTPTIDHLARDGMLFEDAHATSSWTKPSVASLLTGLYPCQHGVVRGMKRIKERGSATTDALAPGIATLAQCLTSASRNCAAFLNNVQLDKVAGLHRGFDTYVSETGDADAMLDRWRSWLVQRLDGPTFSYLHFMETHWPYEPRRRHVALFGGDRDQSRFRDFSARDFGQLRKALHRGTAELSPDELTDMVRLYDAAIRRLDGKVKLLLRSLDELGLGSDTTLVITADHGEEFMEHGAIGHGHMLFREVTHVPLVAWGPGLPAGTRRGAPVSLVDLPATIAALAGANDKCSGGNLLDTDRGQTSPVFAELTTGTRHTQMLYRPPWRVYRQEQGARSGRSEFSPEDCGDENKSLQFQVFNLHDDPHEKHDLVCANPSGDQVKSAIAPLNELRARLRGETSGQAATAELDAAVVERIRALGYLE